MKKEHIPFPKIGQLRDVVHQINFEADGQIPPTLNFTGTVKLHGTNAAIIREPDGSITVQSRSRILTSAQDDNAGFWAYVNSLTEEQLNSLFISVFGVYPPIGERQILYGEWCGGSIQKGVALNQLPKMFVVFTARWVSETEHTWVPLPERNWWITGDPVFFINQIPKFHVSIDFNDTTEAIDKITRLVARVEEECPFAKSLGVTGVGEGIVWTRDDNPSSRYWFKTKGEEHSKSHVQVLKPVNTETLTNVDKFVEYALSDDRLTKGIDYLREMQLPISQSSTGDYLKWIGNDVLNEEQRALGAQELEWKTVAKQLSNKARQWFFAYLQQC